MDAKNYNVGFFLYCLQRGEYYGDILEDGKPKFFNTLRGVKKHLIEYHSVDLNDEEMKEMKKLNAQEIANAFDWEIRKGVKPCA